MLWLSAGEAGPEIAIAACAHLLSPDVPPSAVAAAFEQNRLPAADVAERGLAALQPERLAVRIDGFVYRCVHFYLFFPVLLVIL